MSRPIRSAVVVLAALALAGCGAGSSPVDPSGATVLRPARSLSDTTTVSTTTSDADAEDGVHTMGGGG